MFTIEVKKKGRDEKFDFYDLELFHQDCYKGKIKLLSCSSDGTGGKGAWLLTCQRCGESRIILVQEHTAIIIKTAVDGQERNLETVPNKFRKEK